MIAVGVEGYAISGRRTGIGRYVAELLAAAARRTAGEMRFTVAYFSNNPDGPGRVDDLRAAGVAVHHPPRRVFDVFRYGSRAGLPLPFDLLLPRQDVLLFPNFRRYPSLRAPSMTFVHDLSHLAVPDCVPPDYRAQLARYVDTAVRRSDAIGAISHTVAGEIAAAYPEARGRIVVAPPAHSGTLSPWPPPDWRQRLGALDLRPGFVLHVGTLEPRKNLLPLVQAMGLLDERTATAHPLVLVGARSWDDERLLEAVAASRGRVRYLEYVDDPTLRSLYEGAAALAFPSRYEGFGMPLLEALASGVPVLCSDIGVFREIAGEAATYFPPSDVQGIAWALEALVDDEKRRAAAIALGRQRAEAYSWDRSAAVLVEALRDLAVRRRSGRA